MNEAIKLAIEKGGYDNHLFTENFKGELSIAGWEVSVITQDPAFWRALGKANGWNLNTCTFCLKDGGPNSVDSCDYCGRSGVHRTSWKAHWHRFIDHIADGRSADDFFKALLAERRGK